MKKLFKLILCIIYPNKCMSCGVIIEEGLNFCENCLSKLHRIDPEKFCTVCGCDRDKCKCKYSVYRFKAAISPFKNKDSAQAALYAYKFAGKLRNISFFADEMVKTANTLYKDVIFDYICYVPTSFTSVKKYGFNHNRTLALEVAKRIGITLKHNALKCRPFRRHQHNSSSQQRKKNVIGKYYSKCNLSDAKILLIDDIKTTGSSLDECTKELLFAGADSVYCLTALCS